MYYDCHTYNTQSTENDYFGIVNYTETSVWNESFHYSVGIHPWDITENDIAEKKWSQVEEKAIQPSVIAIGECGIDTLKKGPLPLQEYFFQKHVTLANTLSKPLIIHSVHAVEQTCKILKDATVPVIIHGINNKIGKINPFILNNFYLSFGNDLFNTKSISRQTIKEIPMDHLLLETDDGPYSIKEIYQTAASCLSMSLESLTLQIQDNFHRIFNL